MSDRSSIMARDLLTRANMLVMAVRYYTKSGLTISFVRKLGELGEKNPSLKYRNNQSFPC
jgi:hypothetical protein